LYETRHKKTAKLNRVLFNTIIRIEVTETVIIYIK